MTGPVCGCGKPSPGAYLCKACTQTLQWWLITAAVLAPDLDAAAARLTQRAPAGGRAHSDALPFDERASHAGAHLLLTLARWAREVPP